MIYSIQFPGAVNSKFTSTLRFHNPHEHDAMPTYRIMDQSGNLVDKSRDPIDISDAEILKMYRDMLTISIMDPIMYQAQRQGRLSFYMMNVGEEGIAVGSASALNPEDVMFPQYREAGVFLYRGFTLNDFMNQLFANRLDNGKGRNMPVHYGSRALNIHTISSPLATQLPHAAGAAYALKLQHLQNPSEVPKRAVACYFGEGAASEGDFHAALNIAATRNCPAIFICRNNGYAISTPSLEQYRGDGIASRGVGYGIDTIRVDGNDIFAVREVTRLARDMALEGDMKPVLIEAMSYRVSHHSTSDDSTKYRESREIESWKRRDNPITRLRKWMENKGLWDEEQEKEAQSSIKKEVLKAFNAAEREKRPPIREMMTDVYEEVTEEQRAQMEELRDIVERYPDEYEVDGFEEGLEGISLPKKD
jgi:2-oxoisovalerate dehydrogenase E1 component alpha subunit